MRKNFSKAQLGRVDLLGTFLLLSATILLVGALEEAGVRFQWGSAFVIVVLILSGLSWTAFFAWSRRVTHAAGVREPVFPWRFVQDRVSIGLFL